MLPLAKTLMLLDYLGAVPHVLHCSLHWTDAGELEAEVPELCLHS